MNLPNNTYNDGERCKSRVYKSGEVEDVYKRESSILSQASAMIFFLVYIFFAFLPQKSEIVLTCEIILTGTVLVLSALAIVVIIVHCWRFINKFLKISLTFVCILTLAALILDVLNPISAYMFQIKLNETVVKAGLIVILMLLPISLFPALFLYREQINKNLIIWSLWLFVFSVIPLLVIRILKIAL